MTVRINMVFHRHRNRIRQLSQPATTHFVISVNNRLAAVVRGVQQPFRRFVAFHIAVIIEVIATQVGEYRRRKFQRGDAMLDQPVRRDFHRGKGCALPCQTRQHVLHVDRRTGGIFRRIHFAQQTVTDGTHHRAGFAQQFGPLRHQLRGGGFTVGARHANQTQLVRRFIIKTSRQGGKTLI
ncbi:hypothetical protein D3C76_971440 [compost metagenome]